MKTAVTHPARSPTEHPHSQTAGNIANATSRGCESLAGHGLNQSRRTPSPHPANRPARPHPNSLDRLSDSVAGTVQHHPLHPLDNCPILNVVLSSEARSCPGTKVLAEYVL